MFFAVRDAGTYRLTGVRCPDYSDCKIKMLLPETSRHSSLYVLGYFVFGEISVHFIITLRVFWKRRTHLPVFPCIAIIFLI